MRILIVGATGLLGTSVAQRLLNAGRYAVRVLTRRPDSDEARQLREMGAEIAEGDLDHRASLRAALRDCDTVIAAAPVPPDQEESQGRNLINAVAGSDTDFFVFCNRNQDLEEYARSLGLPVTFVRVDPDAIGDVSKVVAPMFEEPDKFIGQTIEVSGKTDDTAGPAESGKDPRTTNTQS